jgi:hypothetical protein
MATQADVQLEFPFLNVDDVEIAFGGIRNYGEVCAAVPTQFYEHNEWSSMASYFFSQPLTENDAERLGAAVKIDSKVVVKAQFDYLRTWLGSFQPKHEIKMAVCSWLLSLMFKHPVELGE